MLPPEPVQQALQELRRRLVERFGSRLLSMTLYGSYARGEAGPESDVDVCVVLEGLRGRERTEVYDLGADVQLDTGVPVAPLALSDNEAADLRRLERLLWRDIEREGIPL